MLLWLWITLGSFGFVGLMCTLLLRRVVRSNIKNLSHPPINFHYKCKAAARYDTVHINPTEIYLGAFFLMPIRLVITLALVIITTSIVLFFKLIFWGSIPDLSSEFGEQPKASRKVICLACDQFLLPHEIHLVRNGNHHHEQYQAENQRRFC